MLSESLQRPKPGETEEDVLLLQEEFLKSGNLPSATLVKSSADGKLQGRDIKRPTDSKVKKSYYKAQQEKKCRTQERILNNLTVGGGQNISCSVATDVKERDTVTIPEYLPGLTRFAKDGFPSAPVIQKEGLVTQKENTSQCKKSIFALMFESMSPERFGLKENTPLQNTKADSVVGTSSFDPSFNSYDRQSKGSQLEASSLLTGDGLACGGLSKVQAANELCRIHEENLHLLAGLTQEEILEEQTRIKELLGSKVSVFKKKSKVCEEEKLSDELEVDETCS